MQAFQSLYIANILEYSEEISIKNLSLVFAEPVWCIILSKLDFFRVSFALSWRCLPVAAVEEEAVERESSTAVPPG